MSLPKHFVQDLDHLLIKMIFCQCFSVNFSQNLKDPCFKVFLISFLHP